MFSDPHDAMYKKTGVQAYENVCSKSKQEYTSFGPAFLMNIKHFFS